MAQKEQTTASPAPAQSPAENSMGLKAFNRTGQENTTTDVLRPVVSSATRRRNALLIGVVLIAICIMAALAFQRSGLSFIPSPDAGKGLGDAHTGGNPDRSE